MIEQLQKQVGNDAIICTEVGQNRMWTAQFTNSQNPALLSHTGGLGTMGFRLPAAMGAALTNPGVPVIDVCDDGSTNEYTGTGHSGSGPDPGQDSYPQQHLFGDGASVAGSVSQ